jgi:hypothetical protein
MDAPPVVAICNLLCFFESPTNTQKWTKSPNQISRRPTSSLDDGAMNGGNPQNAANAAQSSEATWDNDSSALAVGSNSRRWKISQHNDKGLATQPAPQMPEKHK